MVNQPIGNHGLGIFFCFDGFDLGPLIQGQTRIANLKVLITCLLLILEVYSTKPTHMKSWARNLLMFDLTFSPPFKVKRWFTGFGELSLWWIQICIGSPMRRSSCGNINAKTFMQMYLTTCLIVIKRP